MTTPLSDADLKQIWARWEKGIETYDDLVAAGDDIPHLLAEVDRLRARVARLEGVLREVEWSGDTGDDRWNSCPYCEGHQPDHAPDCALDAALRGADE
ncbi:MAG: hypothetical protein WC683_08585 [bacterium]